jgi:RNA polymerase sigma factor (sigma-70 family)
MSATGLAVGAPTDAALVAGVRAGEDSAFEELYRRYRPRINSFVRRFVRDDGRAEDVTQEAFLSALRRMRATDSEIVFRPWIYEIARNAAIDAHRRSRRAEEVSIEAIELMAASDRLRLLGTAIPETSAVTRERLRYLRGAFDELSETHHRVLVMRELEGRSYREIAERMDLTRPAVESTLFRARRRLERMYDELETGRRCDAVRAAIGRLAEDMGAADDGRRVARHLRRCRSCRRSARELGVKPLGRLERVRAKAAALLPLPFLLRPRAAGGTAAHGLLAALGMGPPAGQAVSDLAQRAVALLAAAALASAGSALLEDHVAQSGSATPAVSQPAPSDGFVIPRFVLPSAPVEHPKSHSSRARSSPRGHSHASTGDTTTPAASATDSPKSASGQGAGSTRSVVPTSPAPERVRSTARTLRDAAPKLNQTLATAKSILDRVKQPVVPPLALRDGWESRPGLRSSGDRSSG